MYLINQKKLINRNIIITAPFMTPAESKAIQSDDIIIYC